MDNYTLFNVKSLGGSIKDTYLHTVQLKPTKQTGRLGTPGIILKPQEKPKKKTPTYSEEKLSFSDKLMYRGSTVAVYYPFPYTPNLKKGGMGLTLLNTDDLLITGEASILDTHCIGSLSKVDLRSKEINFDIQDNLHDNNGGITYLISDKKSITTAIDSIRYFIAKYKYNTLMSWTDTKTGLISDFDDRVLASVSFIPLKHWIPVFNYKKVDGCGLIIRLISEQKAEANKSIADGVITELFVLCTNYKENVFELDGSVIMSRKTLSSEYIDHIARCNEIYEKNCWKKIKPKSKLTKKKNVYDEYAAQTAKEAKEIAEAKMKQMYEKESEVKYATTTAYYYTGGTSSTSSTY